MFHSNAHLAAMQLFLTETVKANEFLTLDDLDPIEIVNQIYQQLHERSFCWVDNTLYIPDLLKVYSPPSPDKMEEIEVIFNSVVFTKYLYEYITEVGYKLFDLMRIEVEPASTAQNTTISFQWQTEESHENFTVKLNEQDGKIVELYTPKAEIFHLARLKALNAEAYRAEYVITKEITYLGRLRNIIDKETAHMLRRNDFVFSRHPDPLSVNNSVSRLHAKIVFQNGRFWLYDTGSANGTFIIRKGRRLDSPNSNWMLEDKDIITLGSAQISFELIDEEEATKIASLPVNLVPDLETLFAGNDVTQKTMKLTDIREETSKRLGDEE
ncbi:MAG: FHA domain-containing protein [Blastocatellia bacterium]|nr:FHA domain-containing protein [Blastocatellia bacterium]